MSAPNKLRSLPAVDTLLNTPAGAGLVAFYGHEATVGALRATLDDLRARLRDGEAEGVGIPEIVALSQERLARSFNTTLHGVINATGVVIHTNLGRAPLSAAALEAMREVAAGYSTLEYDLDAGQRGSRSVHAEALLTKITGAEAALVVNNNAAAILLALTALAQGREVVISRGQLIEIGGGFRVPDVMVQSGARLVEVGTTNRTRASDYEQAITEQTALLLRAHHSNFKLVGFVEETPLETLATIAHARDVYLVDDLGSGALLDTALYGLEHEPMVQESLAAGSDLICFSGDKLLGGPQAGIIVGRAHLVDRLKRHPLARAVRADKLCLAALSATLLAYLRGSAAAEIPVWRMIARTVDDIHDTAAHWASAAGGRVIDGESTVGGGSLPGATLPTALLALDLPHPDTFVARLRSAPTPVIARIADGLVLLDPRTVLPGQEQSLLDALLALLQET